MNRKLFSLLVFLAGFVFALLALIVPSLERLFENLEQARYAGSFITGILYGMSFTAPSATVIFANMPESLDPWLVALVGGLGAFLYDLTVFTFFRHESHKRFAGLIRSVLHLKQRRNRFLFMLLGAAIIASPLPDELGIGLLGFSQIHIPQFLALSFFLNSLGILIITSAL